ncbi:MAG: FkbM family methyltransferase [Armatimonadetes bacterium]|nr:FkbM family methyltransferase [Armatimonadota bacterium]
MVRLSGSISTVGVEDKDYAMTMMVSYAQYQEDVMLWRALNDIKSGFYVDVGACNPVSESVTKHFYDQGWRGINIDPVRSYIDMFERERPRDINLNFAISDQPGSIILYEVIGTGLSTTITKYADNCRARGLEVRSYEVPTKTLTEVLADHPVEEIHFLKIDTEGAEKSVLSGIDLDIYRPWIVAVESTIPLTYTPIYQEWEALLLNRDYVFAASHEINRFYVAVERAPLAERFKIPIDIYRLHADVQEIERLQAELTQKEALTAHLQESIDRRPRWASLLALLTNRARRPNKVK